MLEQFLKMASKKQTLPPGWEKEYFAYLREKWEKEVAAGNVRAEKLRFFDCEVTGSRCPLCGGSPKEINQDLTLGGFKLGEYTLYELGCDCEKKQDSSDIENRETRKRIEAAEIPDDFKNTNWADWDNSVDAELTRTFEKVRKISAYVGIIGKGIILMGSVGRGKTMTGICILNSILISTKKKCKFIAMADFTQRIIKAGQDGRSAEDMQSFDVLFLDDIDKLSAASVWVQERVFSMVDYMIRENKTLIITTNKRTFQELADHFGQNGEAITSRMIDKMEFARFEGGEDYRKLRRVRQNKT